MAEHDHKNQQNNSRANAENDQQQEHESQHGGSELSPPEFSVDSPPTQFKSADDSSKQPIQSNKSETQKPGPIGQLEAQFGADFSNVKIYEGSGEAESLQAKAFARGNEIHFASGMYDPNSKSGQELLGHEAAHVVQQRQGRVQADAQRKGVKTNENSGLESEADQAGQEFAEGKQVQMATDGTAGSGSNVVQGNFFQDAWDATTDAVGGAVDAATDMASDAWDATTGAVGGVVDGVTDAAGDAWDWASGMANRAVNAADNFLDQLSDGARAVFSRFQSAGSAIWDRIKALGAATLEKLARLGSGIIEWVVALGGDVVENLRRLAAIVDNGLDYLMHKIKQIVGKVRDFGASALRKLIDIALNAGHFAASIFDAILTVGKKMASKLWQFITKVANAVEQQIYKIVDIIQNIGEAFFDSAREVWEMFFPTGQAIGPGNIPPQHMIYEYFGHRIVYLNEGQSLVGNDAKIMEAAGYDPRSLRWLTGAYGLQMASIQPLSNDDSSVKKLPMLAFRGTTSLQGVITDFNFTQVGQNQYYGNESNINQFAAQTGSRMDVMGHSLGGAMAQIFTANNASKVANLVTFNAPAIDSAEVDKFNAATAGMSDENRPQVTHHIAQGDIVSAAGEANIGGRIIRHDNGADGNPVAAHTNYFFDHENYDQWRQDLGIQDEYQQNLGIRQGEYDVMEYQHHPQLLLRKLFAEPGRKLVSIGGHMLPAALLGYPGPVVASIIAYMTRNKDFEWGGGDSK